MANIHYSITCRLPGYQWKELPDGEEPPFSYFMRISAIGAGVIHMITELAFRDTPNYKVITLGAGLSLMGSCVKVVRRSSHLTASQRQLVKAGILTLPYDDWVKEYQLEEWIHHCPKEHKAKLRENLNNIRIFVKEFEVCDLVDFQLTWLPDSLFRIPEMKQIKFCYCNGNQLEKLPSSINFLDQVEWFDAKNNILQFLPDSFGQLSNLKLLNLSNNQFKEIPPSIGLLTQLKILIFDDNQVESLDSVTSSFNRLANLGRLDICNNLLKEIPSSITTLNLKKLNLINNQLVSLPDEFFSLSMDCIFFINGNPFSDAFSKRMKDKMLSSDYQGPILGSCP